MRYLSAFCAAVVGFSLSGCWPAMVRYSPQVRGTVTAGNSPASGAQVFVQSNANDACDASSLHAIADQNGVFEVATGRRFELYSPIQLGDRGFGWRMCIIYEGKYFAAFGQGGWGGPPKKVRLACDLSAGEVPSASAPYGPGLCRALDE
jgi:hypothetical protein